MIATPKMPVTASRRPQLDDLPTRALAKVLEDLALGAEQRALIGENEEAAVCAALVFDIDQVLRLRHHRRKARIIVSMTPKWKFRGRKMTVAGERRSP